jgi:hypothetical protein
LREPAEIIHALDFFIWAALDEIVFPPTEPRPFSDGERYYNAVLNKHFRIDARSTAEESFVLPLPPAAGDPADQKIPPTYFPDEGGLEVFAATRKDLAVLNHFEYRVQRLRNVARVSNAVREGTVRDVMPTSPWVLVNPPAYPWYFRHIRDDQGLRFADATHEHREAVTLTAPMVAVIAPYTDDPSRILLPYGWKQISPGWAKLIGDMLDPEALLLPPRPR